MLNILLKPCIFMYRFVKYFFLGIYTIIYGILFLIFNFIKYFVLGITLPFRLLKGHKNNKPKENNIQSSKISDSKKVIVNDKNKQKKENKEKLYLEIEKQKKLESQRQQELEKKQAKLEIENQKRLEREKQIEAKKQQKLAKKQAKFERENKRRLEYERKLDLKIQQKLEKKKQQEEKKKNSEKELRKQQIKEEKEKIKQQKLAAKEEQRRKQQEILEEKKRQQIEKIHEEETKKEEKALSIAKKREEKEALKLEKKQKKEQYIKDKKDRQNKIDTRRKNDTYINENATKEKVTLSDKILKKLKEINNLPSKISEKLKNNTFARNRRNKKDIHRQALLIDFNSENEQKSDVKLLYKYEAKDKTGRMVTGYFEAFSRVEVHSFLLSEGYEVYSITTNKWITFFHGRGTVNKTKFKTKDLHFFLTQLSTYIKAGIPLVEALRILSKQFKKNKAYQRIFKSIIYELTMGEAFSSALDKQGVAFPKLLINMVKTAEMTGELPEVLDDMSDYYYQTEETKKQMISALTYPSIVFVFAIAVITFVLIYVIPQFSEMYASMDSTQIPAFTQIVINVSDFLKKYIGYLFIGLILLLALFIFCYNHFKLFRTVCQWVFMHMPVVGTTMIYNEVTLFTKTFGSLLSHNVSITECLDLLNRITNNEIYKMLILDTITNLAKGGKISDAFEDHWAFPIPAYEMIVTGERTGELPDMLNKVSVYYQSLHRGMVQKIKTFIEPILTIFLTVMVGIIVLAIVIPMFNMYESVANM